MPPWSLIFCASGRDQQRADHDGRASEAAGVHDEPGLSSLAGAGGSAQQDDLLGEPQVFVADLFFEGFPDRVEDDLGVFDFQVRRLPFLFFGETHGSVCSAGAAVPRTTRGPDRFRHDDNASSRIHKLPASPRLAR